MLIKPEWPVWLELAHQDCVDGVKEIPGPKYHEKIITYLSSVKGLSHFKSDEIPWCASAMNYWLKTAGVPHTNSPLARSLMTIGRPTEAPKEGDIAVFFDRRNDVHGHTGMFICYSHNKKRVLILGGNQGDEVSYYWYPVDGTYLYLASIRRIDL